MTRRAPIACLLTLAVVAGGAGGAPATVAKTPKKHQLTACQKLRKHYGLLVRTSKLVVVRRGDDETGRISACALPRGKVRTLASWDDGLTRDRSSVVKTAGTRVLVADTHSDQYGGTSRVLTRVDVSSGRRLVLSSFGCMLDYSQPGCTSGTNYDEVGIAPSGAGAIERTDYADGQTTLEAFSPAGAFAKLADGAVEALRVTSTQVEWTQAGVRHTAPISFAAAKIY